MNAQNLNVEQPKPIESKNAAVWDMVIEDVASQVSKLKEELDGIECAESGQAQTGKLETARRQIEILNQTINDMRQRDNIGLSRYGCRLRPHNGRDALIDAYQESLDLAVYLKQQIMERQDAFARMKETAIKEAKAVACAEVEKEAKRLHEHIEVCLASASQLYRKIAK